MPIGARVILGPQRQALPEIAIESPGIAVVRAGWKHEARKGPLALRLPVRRQLKIKVLHARELVEGMLKGIQGAEKNEAASQQTRGSSPDHRWHPSREYHSPLRSIAILASSSREPNAFRSSLRTHRRISGLDAGRLRFLSGHAVPHRDRKRISQIRLRHRAFHHGDAGLSPAGRVPVWIAGRSLRPPPSPD